MNSLLDDIKSSNNNTFVNENGNYKLTVDTNYPNNPKLIKEEIIFDKESNVREVNVLNKDNNKEIKMKFNKIDLKSKFSKEHFLLKNVIDVNKAKVDLDNNEDNKESDKVTNKVEDVIYPMYLPLNTYLSNTEKIKKEDGERLILTFDGDNPFMLIEETISYEDKHLIIPTFGELEFMASTVAIVGDNSVNWIDNNLEYYVVSDKLSKEELLDIARSVSVLPVSK